MKRESRYQIILKGGPLHNQEKDYTLEYDDMPLGFDDLEIVPRFETAQNRFVDSRVIIRHNYIPTRLRDNEGRVCYFFDGTITAGQREIQMATINGKSSKTNNSMRQEKAVATEDA